MAKRIKITLTEEHISLIRNFNFGEIIVSHPEQSLSKNVELINKKLDELKDEYGSFATESFDYNVSIIKGQLSKIMEASARSQLYALFDDTKYFGIDTYDMFNGGTIEQIARIIGCYDKVIPGTEEDFDGPKFPEDIDKHIHDTYIFVRGGGIQPNVTYVAYDNEHIWYTEEEFEERRKKK